MVMYSITRSCSLICDEGIAPTGVRSLSDKELDAVSGGGRIDGTEAFFLTLGAIALVASGAGLVAGGIALATAGGGFAAATFGISGAGFGVSAASEAIGLVYALES